MERYFPYFMILEAFTGYSLYLVGVYLRRKGFLAGKMPVHTCLLGALACLVLLYFTFD